MNREKLNRLQQEHGELVTQAQAITQLCEEEQREPTEDEKTQFQDLLQTADGLRSQADEVKDWIKQQERLVAQQAWREEVQKVRLPEPLAANEPHRPQTQARTPQTEAERIRMTTATPEYAAAFADYARTGRRYATLAGGYTGGGDLPQMADGPMQTDVDSAGGYLIPDNIADGLIQEEDRAFVALQMVRSMTLGFGESIDYPYTKERLVNAQRAGERGGTPPSSRPQIETITLNPILVWNETAATIVMLGNRHFDIENYLRDELLYTLMYRCEQDLWTGKGGISPLGLLTAADAGISTARDVKSGAAAGITFGAVFDAHYKTLRPPYWMNSAWYWNPALVGELRKLTDTDGQFLWQPSVQLGAPDRLDGIPVHFSEFIPNSLTANTYIGLLGDLRYYRRVEYPSIAVQRLVELGAKRNEIQFLARKWDDGGPVLEEAFVRIQVGT